METTIKEKKQTYRPLVLDEEQQLLRESAKDYLREKSPVAAFRKLRDEANPQGYDKHLWQEMAQMGWAGLTIAEEFGGMNYGYLGLGIVLEEMGRTLTSSPINSTVLLGATLVSLGGSEAQKKTLLGGISEGKLVLTLALEEGNHHQSLPKQTTATKTAEGYTLQGQKTFVMDGHVADKMVVVARTSGNATDTQGITLFLVDAKAAGVNIHRSQLVDCRNYAKVSFENVTVSAEDVIGNVGEGFAILEKTLNIARIGLSAEMLGMMQEAFDRTMVYLKERKQFGVPIGSFQGLQHRSADMYCHIELCKSVVLKALMSIEEDSAQLPMYASLAKAKVGQTLARVSNEAVQMFGGIGVTDDEEIGFFLKRARVAQQSLGDYTYHLQRLVKFQKLA
jgi:acyl-CoA dehydrogenase